MDELGNFRKTATRVGNEETVNLTMQISEDLKEKIFELAREQVKDLDGDFIDYEGKRYFVHVLANYIEIIEE